MIAYRLTLYTCIPALMSLSKRSLAHCHCLFMGRVRPATSGISCVCVFMFLDDIYSIDLKLYGHHTQNIAVNLNAIT